MMQRLRDALQRGVSEQAPNRQYRPNELRRDVVRAERLRREAQRGELEAIRPRLPPEEQQARRIPPVSAPLTPARGQSWHVSALKTRSGLRQAWVLKEILGPPMALRGPRIGDDER